MKRFRQWRGFRWVRDLGLIAAVYVAIQAYQKFDLPSGPAPALVAADLSGKTVSLEDYRGNPVILRFWATWCGVCRAEEHNIEAVAGELPVLTVASRSGDAEQLLAYAREHDVSWPIVPDPQGTLAQRFQVSAFPTTFVLDGAGEVRHVAVGYTTELGLRLRMWLASL